MNKTLRKAVYKKKRMLLHKFQKWVRSEKMRHKLKIFTKFQTSLFNFWGAVFDCIYIEVCKSKLAIKKTKEWKKYSLLSIDINQQNFELEHIFQHFLEFILYKESYSFLVKIITGTITTNLRHILCFYHDIS